MSIKIIPAEYAEYMRKMNMYDGFYHVAQARVDKVDEALEQVPDDTAAALAELFEEWQPDAYYAKGKRLCYGDELYRVEQDHTSQSDWLPPNVPALYTRIAKPGEIPVWKQPTGAQDAYMKGDKVHFPEAADPVYASDVDNNVWSPDVYGWTRES